MPEPGLARGPTGPGRLSLWAVCACIFLYYWALLSDGKFLEVMPVRYGLVFNSMIDYLARGRFDVDPAIVLKEGFFREGHTYAYFGVLPALLRLPLLVWPRFAGIDFTTISCAIAAALAAAAKLGAIRQARLAMGDAPYARRVTLFAMAAVLLGGAQVQFLRPAIFQEPLYWASALAAAFGLMAFRWCVDALGRRERHLLAMAILAGLCLLTRVSTSMGLYAACGGIMLSRLIVAWRGSGGAAAIFDAIRRAVIPSLVLLSFAAICGYINYERWGSPLTFQDYKYYNSMAPNDPAFTVIANYGYFNLRRLWFGLSYFFLPIWTIFGSDGHFLFRAFQDRLLYIVESPPATFLASDLFLGILTCLGVAWLWRARATPADRLAAWFIAAGLFIPCILILIAIAITFRYRMEFYPFFEFLGLFGLFSLRHKIASHPRPITWACGATVAISIVFSHLFLVAYKVGPWGDSVEVEQTGWIGAYQEYFHLKYPALDHLIERVDSQH